MRKPTSAEAYFDKAERALRGARALLAIGDAEGACNRAYYAMFDAMHAALFVGGYAEAAITIRTHAGLLAFFGKQLVGTERIAGEFGRAINQVQRLRLTADYLGDLPSDNEATWAVERAEAFLQAVAVMMAAS